MGGDSRSDENRWRAEEKEAEVEEAEDGRGIRVLVQMRMDGD